MKTNWMIAGIVGLVLTWPAGSFADDTAIYGVATSTDQPNVLIVLDRSGGMADAVPGGPPYDPNTAWPSSNSCVDASGKKIACDPNMVYMYKSSNKTYTTWAKLSDVQSSCAKVYTPLNTTGQYAGGLNSNGTCPKNPKPTSGSFYTGNWMNWNATGNGVLRPKIDIAKEVVSNLINSTRGVRFGMMNYNTDSNQLTDAGGSFITYNGYTPYVQAMTSTTRAQLVANVNALTAHTYTPLAETLFEAMRYYQGAATAFPVANGNITYPSPIQAGCQLNYVLFVTDGMSTHDNAPVLQTICNKGDCDGDNDAGIAAGTTGPFKGTPIPSNGTDYMDDVAKYMHEHNMIASMPGSTVTTYTVGFGLQPDSNIDDKMGQQLLQDTAANGGGQYFLASSAQDLSKQLTNIVGGILQVNSSFVAPVVPVSSANRTYSGSSVYVGFFMPQNSGFWYGNLKKFGFVNDQVVDKNGNPATDPLTGAFVSTAQSYWSTVQDAGLVTEGGVGALLVNRTLSTRNLYTYLGTNALLTNSSNGFNTTNVTPAMLGYTPSDTTSQTNLINFVYGYDAYGINPSATRGWILGDILHSQPAVVNYNTNLSVIYVGGNDGMLHAFEDTDPNNTGGGTPALDGQELWGFIPQDLLANLNLLTSSTHDQSNIGYFVDGSPSVYVNDANHDGKITTGGGDQVIVVFGERRGGSNYWALDVTDPVNPRFLWSISPSKICTASPLACTSTTTYGELGQSWSQPQITLMNINGTVKPVFFISGGYDVTNEDATPATADAQGRAVYAVDLVAGTKIWEYSYTTSGATPAKCASGTNSTAMCYAIPSDLALIDSNDDGYADRLFIGDVGGQIWRFDVTNTNPTLWSGRILFKSNASPSDGTSGRKIFYRPDATRQSGYYDLYFGTGDREHPLDGQNAPASTIDRIYSVKDLDGSTALLNETNLTDVTLDDLQAVTGSTVSTLIANDLNTLASSSGWYIRLVCSGTLTSIEPATDCPYENTGEKVVSSPVVFGQWVNISTYQPNFTSATSDPCAANLGIGRIYQVNYQTGEAVNNYDSTNDSNYANVNSRAQHGGVVLQRSDRIKTVGSGIPSAVVIAIPEKGNGTCDATALIGIGGGVEGVQTGCGGTTQRIFWKELF